MEYNHTKLNQGKVQSLVEEYTQIRMNDAMVKSEFAEGLSTGNRAIYLQLLREKIVDELKLSGEAYADELIYNNLPGEDPISGHI